MSGVIKTSDGPITWANVGGSTVNVVDNLESTSTTDALSANQGRVLKDSLNNITDYSTSEVAIGKWIDGKTLYRMIIVNNSALPNNQATIISQYINTTLNIIKVYGMAKDSYGSTLPIPFASTYDIKYQVQTYVVSSGLTIATGQSSNITSCHIIVEYTKD